MAGMKPMSVAMVRGSIQSGGKVVRLGLAGVLAVCCLMGCASSEQIREKQAAAQATQSQEDDAQCRASGAPETAAYQECREKLVEKRAEEQAAQERRREAFQKTTAEGTSALSGH
jgi:ubiquitin